MGQENREIELCPWARKRFLTKDSETVSGGPKYGVRLRSANVQPGKATRPHGGALDPLVKPLRGFHSSREIAPDGLRETTGRHRTCRWPEALPFRPIPSHGGLL
jgi:hypothetical protein